MVTDTRMSLASPDEPEDTGWFPIARVYWRVYDKSINRVTRGVFIFIPS